MGMQWLLNLITTKYGKVNDGKYKGCDMGIGTDDKGVAVNITYTKLLFIKGFKTVDEVRIETLKSYKILLQSPKATTIILTHADGQRSTVDLPAVDANGQPFQNDRVGLVLGALSKTPIEE